MLVEKNIRLKIKKKCGECQRIRPIAEFKSTNGRCVFCTTQPASTGGACRCLKCDEIFESVGKFNKICIICKSHSVWSDEALRVEF